MSGRRPNFLCIVTDQHRADHLGCAGHPVLRTPHIDRLAEGGVRFSRAYINNPLCMPSRATMFTGRTPRGHGVRTNGIPLDPAIPTMTDALYASGYRTHGIGKVHLSNFIFSSDLEVPALDPKQFPEADSSWRAGAVAALPEPYFGLQTTEFVGGHAHYLWGDYRKWLDAEHPGAYKLMTRKHALEPPTGDPEAWKSALPAELHPTAWIADRTIAFLRERARTDEPFFLWCSFPDPHHAYNPPRPWCDMYDPGDVPMPARREGELDLLPPHFKAQVESAQWTSGRIRPTKMPDAHLREILALTYGLIGQVDHHLGRILDCLDELGLTDDTAVSFFSDHGDLMGDHWLINKGPFHFEGLVRVPFLWRYPRRFPARGETAALASMLDFAPTVLDLAGVPIPEGPTTDPPVAPEAPPAWPGRSLVPVLTGEATSVQDSVLIENDEDHLGLRLRTLVTDTHKLTVYPGQTYGELFDLTDDPNELCNRWADPACRGVRDELMIRLLHRLAETDSALPRRLSHA